MKTLYAFYDLQFGPVSYDFVTWLVRAYREQHRAGCDRLHVVIVPNEKGLGGFAREWGKHDEDATRWRLQHIVLASCPLARATVTVAPSIEMAERMRAIAGPDVWWPQGKAHFMGPLIQESRAGWQMVRLEPTAAARAYVAKWFTEDPRKLVTITLREQTTDPDRNSDMQAWFDFAKSISERYRIVVVGDAHVELGTIDAHPAAMDPDIRLALYEAADMNLMGNNGPQELLKFSAAPYMIFGLALTDGWRNHFKKYFHMEVGDQLPWRHAEQRLIYKADTFENISQEFNKWA